MKCLEIIELRTGSNKNKELDHVLEQLVRELKLNPVNPKIKVYHNYAVDSDYSIHLSHHDRQSEEVGSAVGIQIASILKSFGLVSHNTWIQQKYMLRQTQH